MRACVTPSTRRSSPPWPRACSRRPPSRSRWLPCWARFSSLVRPGGRRSVCSTRSGRITPGTWRARDGSSRASDDGSFGSRSASDELAAADEVGKLAARLHAELAEDVGQVRAHGARGDAERAADRLVGFPLGDHRRDLELARRKRFGTFAGAARRRLRAQLAELVARLLQLA